MYWRGALIVVCTCILSVRTYGSLSLSARLFCCCFYFLYSPCLSRALHFCSLFFVVFSFSCQCLSKCPFVCQTSVLRLCLCSSTRMCTSMLTRCRLSLPFCARCRPSTAETLYLFPCTVLP